MKKFTVGLCGFLVLNIYFNTTTHFVSNSIGQFIGLLLFFPIASFIAKLNGLPGLKGLGLVKGQNGLKYFMVSFVFGFGCWIIMYMTYWQLGKFDFYGIKTGFGALSTVGQILNGFFFGSLINDIITRGYVLNLLKGKLPTYFTAVISIIIYALDDFWNGDLTLVNFVFSIILGCSLTYAFFKTGSVWANTGIHFGLNTAYGLIYGLTGQVGEDCFLLKKEKSILW